MANLTKDVLNINALLALALVDRPHMTAKYKWHKYLRERPRPLFEQLLDALAEAATANPKEIVALSVCIHHATQKIVLFVSANHELSSKTKEHFEQLWFLMHSLALEYGIPRKRPEDALIRHLRSKLLLAIYSFSHKKFKKRFIKWHHALLVFRDRLFYDLQSTSALKGSKGVLDSMEDILETIDSIVAILDTISQIWSDYPDGPAGIDPDDDLWTTFVQSIDFLEVLLGDLETVACVFDDLEIQIDSERRFGPAYALERITCLHRLGNIICRFTDAPRLSSLEYEYDLKVIMVPRAQTALSSSSGWPTTTGDWIRLRNAIYRSHGYSPVDNSPEDFVVPPFPDPHTACECSLVQYLDSCYELNHATHPLEYIGLSRPPTHLSDLWLMTYNHRAHRRQYSMRVSHGVWPDHWVLPQIAMNQVGPKFVKEVLAMYCEYKAAEGKVMFSGQSEGEGNESQENAGGRARTYT
ncbi:hypothetical protein M422DRAFT_41455 [Sphaerobolus stellatus SS14]|nr:hypothetical protein M422DRAFT_41455 [Sphaerobolus stellatus SS14]